MTADPTPANAPLHVCDVADCEEGFELLDDCIEHERTHAAERKARRDARHGRMGA